MSIESDKTYTEKDYGIADRTIIGAIDSNLNTNLLAPTNFLFSFRKIPNMTYFIQEFTLPECGAEPLTAEFVIGPTVKIPKASFSYGTVSIKFLINQDFSNYYAVVQWILENTGYESFITDQHSDKGSSDEGYSSYSPIRKMHLEKLTFGDWFL